MRKLLLWIFLLGVLCPLPCLAQGPVASPFVVPNQPKSLQKTPRWTAIITAHPDDWQLFMGAAICEEARHTRRKLVFICLTGGQADVTTDRYWQGREAGHRASVQQVTNPLSPVTATAFSEKVLVNGHAIDAYRSRNAVAFYLHLPDGGLQGKGLARGRFQSLQQLRDANRPLVPLNGGPAYTSWNDLTQTIRTLLAQEAIKGQLTLHIPQTDTRCNPSDHSDHYLAGSLALNVMKQLECRFFQYVGYDVSKRPVNLTAAQISNQRQVYRAYCQTMLDQGQEDVWDAKHLAFIGHQYVQVKHQAGPQLEPTGKPIVDNTPVSRDETDMEEADNDELIEKYMRFAPAYPNPVAVSTQLIYTIPVAAPVWLRILDMQGREILLLQRGAVQQPGQHEQWLDIQGFPASGTYIAELRVGTHLRRQRLSVIH
ncbi:T9SS type A sorting domain-containing protein [Hymenobacter sp. 102]|uniref:T9SS type A sorting domain-containing protein n=1 Tax=Hymenobacter sp. 102 TaxID=3403152 RepID=UPI003CF5B4EE